MNDNYKQFLQDTEKHLCKRVKSIVKYTLEDFHGNGYSTNESDKELTKWVVKELLSTSGIDDMNTYEISLKVLEMLNSLDIVDLGFIVELMADDVEPSEISIKLQVEL